MLKHQLCSNFAVDVQQLSYLETSLHSLIFEGLASSWTMPRPGGLVDGLGTGGETGDVFPR